MLLEWSRNVPSGTGRAGRAFQWNRFFYLPPAKSSLFVLMAWAGVTRRQRLVQGRSYCAVPSYTQSQLDLKPVRACALLWASAILNSEIHGYNYVLKYCYNLLSVLHPNNIKVIATFNV